ncbi:MAG TPA: glycosyltransferase family 2 protein [Micropepsaceae bacterium]|nr:glycosyltransferase family 2 protein [Micropepsaceae bacterium]
MSQIASLPLRRTETEDSPLRAVPAELSVVVPTFREKDNIGLLVQKLDSALTGIAWEVIFVDDDSPDGTASEAKLLSRKDARVRCIRRIARRGLAGACIEGILSSSAPYVAVMDCDLQHDERILPRMFELLKEGGVDLVVGSRYSTGGNSALSKRRDAISRSATSLAHRLTGVALNDPMSGFFMIRRDCFDPLAPALATDGFKILLDIVLTARGSLRIHEEPYRFGLRQHGESKLDARVVLDFFGLLLAKLTGNALSTRFLSFSLVGGLGLVVHLAVLRLSLAGDLGFPSAQTTAVMVAMCTNFFVNNQLTYRDKRLSGFGLVRGLAGFCAVSSVGAVANIGMATWLYAQQPVWWLAGAAGAIMGAFWNYSLSTLLVWRVK